MLETKERVAPNDFERMELSSLVNLAGEPISHFWPMKTFIHHNPLHGLEHLSFDEAVKMGKRFFGGRGHLPNSEYRNYYKEGRITEESISDAIKNGAQNETLNIGSRKLSRQEVLRSLLIHGTGKIATDVSSAILQQSLSPSDAKTLSEKIQGLPKCKARRESLRSYASRDQVELAVQYTLGEWCDQTLGTKVQDQINGELIKWCGGFLDEGHAPWTMPFRKKNFYNVWKELVLEDASGTLLGIPDWKSKIHNLPNRPEDAVLESLSLLAIPKALWHDYFTLQLAQLSGWAGFIKWRAEQLDYEWQRAFPIDLVMYMAVRLFYERELTALACQDKLAIDGSYTSIQSYMTQHAVGYGLHKEYHMRGLPDEMSGRLDASLFVQNPLSIDALDQCDSELISSWEEIRQQQETDVQALIVLQLSRSLDIPLQDFLESAPEALDSLLEWVDQFPESQHGPTWLKAFESSYLKGFVKHLSPNLQKLGKSDLPEEQVPVSRPLAQAIFCIDVRSEGFRRRLEEVGGNETFGFAGFFGVPICYQGYTSELPTDQCPVLLNPKHIVKEIPRAYQGEAAERFLERHHLAKTGHTLLYDLKENAITPYIMVEAIGWFFGFKLFGQTLKPEWFKNAMSWMKKCLVVPISTTLTVDKIQRDEALEMVASQHRATIYRLLIEQYDQKGAAVSHDQVERLRKLTVTQILPTDNENEELYRLLEWSEADLEQFIRVLREDYHLHQRDISRRMHRITQTGFTVVEQAHFVEMALRILGFTKSFSRLVLFCAHGSSSDNNPYESALDCGACGGNHGISNARALAVMANKAQVRQALAQKGLVIPADTHFLPGQHDTTTDEVQLFDLEEVPATHRKDLLRLQRDLHEAGEKNSRERLTRFPDEPITNGTVKALSRTKQRSVDWSQVRPEWGLSRHSTFIVGRRSLTQGMDLEGRAFLHSYDHSQDPKGRYLEIIMTAPVIVGNWINMEHYFSTVDPMVYGSGSKVYHNIVGRLGVMYGSQSDLCVGLPTQTVLDGERPYHEPMRLFTIIEAPLEIISSIIVRHDILQRLTKNQWIHIVALDPVTMEFHLYKSPDNWQAVN